MSPPSILHEDKDCLAANKPAGLPTQAPAGVPSLEVMVKAHIKETYHKPGNVYLGIPHRLDRPVSGVVLFARNSKCAARLAEQFETRRVRKLYWAVVEGVVDPAAGTWHDWLRKVPDHARAEIVAADTSDAKEAILHYRRLSTGVDGSLLEIELETGRMHQIRVQAASRGHPILGDELYGSVRPFGPPIAEPRERMIALHARELTFLHPVRYEPITVTAAPPPAWTEFTPTSSHVL